MLTRLADGTRVVLREIRPEDKPLLSAALERLSPAANRARFLSAKSRFTQRELAYLTEVDGDRHVAYVAIHADDPQRLIGVGRYVRLPDDPETAEIAITVGDAFHGQGLGRRFGLLLADRARASGVRRFSASMLSDNVAAHRLFATISQQLHAAHEGDVDVVVAELAA